MLFQDRFEAGPLLASRLADFRDPADIVVLTLLRGAVPGGYEGARSLVVYLPRGQRRTTYFTVGPPAQYAVIDADQTHALRPLEITPAMGAGQRGAGDPSLGGLSHEQRIYKRKTV
jgi:hypothetical protein